jgi:hypothetical protein
MVPWSRLQMAHLVCQATTLEAFPSEYMWADNQAGLERRRRERRRNVSLCVGLWGVSTVVTVAVEATHLGRKRNGKNIFKFMSGGPGTELIPIPLGQKSMIFICLVFIMRNKIIFKILNVAIVKNLDKFQSLLYLFASCGTCANYSTPLNVII